MGGDPGDEPVNGPRDSREKGVEPPVGGKPGRARLVGVALMVFAVLMWIAAAAGV